MDRPETTLRRLEPDWKGPHRLRRAEVPGGIYDWLVDEGSLTAQVRRQCREGFRVRLLRQGWGQPLHSERRLLRMRTRERAIVREVELLCGDVPWVFARTLIPASSFRGPARRLAHLGERPLGELLFSDPGNRRAATEVARLLPGHPLFRTATASQQGPCQAIWGRRTLFLFAGQPLLVNEIFLPDIPEMHR